MSKYKITTVQGVIGDMELDNLMRETQEHQDKFWEDHKKCLTELKEKGEYLKPLDIEIEIKENALFDNSQTETPLESCRFEILDFSKI